MNAPFYRQKTASPRETMLAELGQWIGRVAQYSADHPICAPCAERVHGAIAEATARDGTVSFGVLREGIRFDDDVADASGKIPLVRSRLAPILHDRGVILVRFLAGTTIDELRQLVEILVLSPQTIFDRGGAGRLLLDRNVTRVQVEEIAHDITDEDRAEQRRRKELREFFETMLKNLLARREHGIDIGKQLLLLLDHPDLAVTLVEDDPLGVCDAVAALCLMVREEEERTGEELFPKLAKILRALSSPGQDRVLLGLPTLVGEFRDALAWALRLLPEDDLASFSLPCFRRRPDDLDAVFYALTAAIPHDGSRRASLRRLGLSLYDLPEDDAVAEGLLGALAKDLGDFDSFRLDRECLRPHALTLVTRRALLANGRPSRPPSSIRPTESKLSMGDVVKLSARTQRFDRLCAHLPAAAATLSAAGENDAVMGIVQALHGVRTPQWRDLAIRTLRDLTSNEVALALLEDVDRASVAEGAELDAIIANIQLLVYLRPEAVLERLETSDNRKLRRIFLDALPTAGPALLPLVRAKLASSSWFIVRNAIVLVVRAGGTPRDLALVARHPNEKVRLEVARALRSLALDETVVEIAVGLLGDPVSEIRTLARPFVRGDLATDAAVAGLERIAADEKQAEPVRVTAIEALGRSPREGAAAGLARLLQPRGLIDLGWVGEPAAVALRTSPAPNAPSLFAEALASSVRRVRKACERAVELTEKLR